MLVVLEVISCINGPMINFLCYCCVISHIMVYGKLLVLIDQYKVLLAESSPPLVGILGVSAGRKLRGSCKQP